MRRMENRVLVGRDAEVLDHPNPIVEGTKGTVTDETRNTLTIDDSVVPKKESRVMIDEETVEGDELVGRTEDRL